MVKLSSDPPWIGAKILLPLTCLWAAILASLLPFGSVWPWFAHPQPALLQFPLTLQQSCPHFLLSLGLHRRKQREGFRDSRKFRTTVSDFTKDRVTRVTLVCSFCFCPFWCWGLHGAFHASGQSFTTEFIPDQAQFFSFFILWVPVLHP